MKTQQDIEEIIRILNTDHKYRFVLSPPHGDRTTYDGNYEIIDSESKFVIDISGDNYNVRRTNKVHISTSPYRTARLMFPDYTKNDLYKLHVSIGVGQDRSNADFAKEIVRRIIPKAIELSKEIFDTITESRRITSEFQATVDRYKAMHPLMRVNHTRCNWDVNYSLSYYNSTGPYVRELEVHMDGTCTMELAYVHEELAKRIIDLCKEYESK